MSSQWINHPVILSGPATNLFPLEKEHLEELFAAASDKRLWEFIPSDCSVRETFYKVYKTILAERTNGNQYPFVICSKKDNKIIGSTRLLEIVPKDKKVEIGLSWLTVSYWATGTNLECKLLLLTYCFEVLKTIRVQLKADETNIRSRKAIEKTGASFEGILRKDRIRDNGTTRNTAYYSITDNEWEMAKKKITNQLDQNKKIGF